MQVRLCGQLAVAGPRGVVDGAAFGGRRARLAFAVLVLERAQPVERSSIADVLWPGDLPTTWESAVRSTLSKVRSVCRQSGLDHDPLRTGAGTVQLVVADLQVDVEVAADDVIEAERRLARGDAEGSASTAQRAVATLALPFLPGVEGAWIDERRRALHQLHIRAREVFTDALLAAQRWAPAVEAAEGTIELEPLHEPAHRMAMMAHVRSGNRAAALRAYTRCRSVLADELGVDPSPETEQAYLDLLLLEGPDTAPAGRDALPSALRPRDDLPLVAREHELDGLVRWWKSTEDGGGVAVISGEAGIGKSRLARELAATADDGGALVLHGRCDADDRVPFQPFVEALAGQDAVELLDLLQPGTTSGPRPARVNVERDDVFAALRSWADRTAWVRPILLVLDDVQWAGEDTLAALAHLVRHPDDKPLGVLLTHRDDGGEGTALASLLAGLVREGRLHRQELASFDGDAVSVLLSQLGGAALDEGSEAVARELHRVTAGNPFFVGETLRHRLETGSLSCDSGRWTSAADHEQDVAPGVRDVVVARLDGLGTGALDALTLGAIIGPEFDLALLGDCLAGGLEHAVEVVDKAILARVVRSRSDHAGQCRFVHAVVAQTLLGRLSDPRRRHLHAVVADAVAARPDHPQRAALLAWHLVEVAPLTGPGPAVQHSIEAARRAAGALAYDTALGFLRRALELELTPVARADLLIELGVIGARAHASEESHAAFLGAVDLARELGDASLLARAAIGAISGWRGASVWFPDAALRQLALDALDGLDAADEMTEGDVELHVRLLSELSLWTLVPDERQALAAKAMELTTVNSTPEVLVAAFGASRVAWWAPGETARRLGYADRVLAVAAARRDDHLWAALQLHRLADLVQLGDRPAFDEALTTLRAHPATEASRRLRWQVQLFDVTVAMIDGRLDDAHAAASGALAAWGDDPDVDALRAFGMQAAAIHQLQGNAAATAELIELAAIALPDILGFRSAQARVLVDLGDLDAAREVVAQVAADDFAGLPRDNGFPISVALLADCLWVLGDSTTAAALLPHAVGLAGELVVLPGPSVFFGSGDLALAVLHATAGDREAAGTHVDAAIEVLIRFGAPWWADRATAYAAGLLRR